MKEENILVKIILILYIKIIQKTSQTYYIRCKCQQMQADLIDVANLNQ